MSRLVLGSGARLRSREVAVELLVSLMVEAQSPHLSINIWVPSSPKSTFGVPGHRQMVYARMAGGCARCFASPAFLSFLAALVSKAAPVLWRGLLQGQGWGAREPSA